MKGMLFFLPAFARLFSLFPRLYADCDEPKDRGGSIWCEELQPSVNEKQLSCLQKLRETRVVLSGLQAAVKQQSTCPKCKEVFIDQKLYRSYYHRPFMIFGTRDPPVWGIDIYFIFKSGPEVIFVAVLWPSEEGRPIFKTIGLAHEVPKKSLQMIHQLRTDPKFGKFWIDPKDPKNLDKVPVC